MSLELLMKQLQQNTAEIESRRQAATEVLRQYTARFNAMQSRGRRAGGAGGGRGGGGSLNGRSRGLFNGKWPAAGEAHQHGGYGWTKWAGDINVPGSGDFGNPVLAFKKGKVISVQRLKDSYGKNIVIRHPDGSKTRYAHLSGMRVKKGMKVKRGQRIGRVGSTGNSSGPHLHFEIF